MAAAGASSRSTSVSPSVARKVGCAIVPVVVMLAGIGIVVAVFAGRSSDGGSGPSRSFGEVAFDRRSSTITLPGATTVIGSTADRTDVIAVVQDYDGEVVRRLARIRFTADGSDERWRTDPIDDRAYRAEVAVVGGTLFAGIGDELMALDADSGQLRWRTTLSDQVTNGCGRCFAAVGDHLVVRTTDAYVAAFSSRSAEPRWTRRLTSAQGSISVVGDRLFVVDEPESDDQLTAVQTVDPATGKTTRTVAPTCESGRSMPWALELAPGDEVRAIPGASDVLAVFGFGETCVVRWNPGTGAVRWAVVAPDVGSASRGGVLVGEHDVVLAGSSGAPVALDLDTQEVSELAAPPDATVEAALIVGRTLIAGSATNRGTPKRGLVAWDLTSGERTWAVRLSGDPELASGDSFLSSASLFDGSPRVVLVPDGDDGVTAFTFDGEVRTFTASSVALATGEVTGGPRRAFLTRSDSGTPSLTVDAALPDRLLVSIDTVLQAIPPDGRGTVVGYPDGD